MLVYAGSRSILLPSKAFQCIQRLLYHNNSQSSRIACKRT
nr:MAG TPA: hypothetical protein [Caudoviricetes sp.]